MTISSPIKIADFVANQSIERYREMKPDAACRAIVREWPDQLAVLIAEFIFKDKETRYSGMADLIELKQRSENIGFFSPPTQAALMLFIRPHY